MRLNQPNHLFCSHYEVSNHVAVAILEQWLKMAHQVSPTQTQTLGKCLVRRSWQLSHSSVSFSLSL